MQITPIHTARPSAPGDRFEDHFVADISAPGLAGINFVYADQLQGDRSGYAALDAALTAAAKLSTGDKRSPAVIFEADDKRFYVYDSLGGHMLNKHTAEQIDLDPILEHAAAGARAVLTPRIGGAVDGTRLRAVVDGAAQWRFMDGHAV